MILHNLCVDDQFLWAPSPLSIDIADCDTMRPIFQHMVTVAPSYEKKMKDAVLRSHIANSIYAYGYRRHAHSMRELVIYYPQNMRPMLGYHDPNTVT